MFNDSSFSIEIEAFRIFINIPKNICGIFFHNSSEILVNKQYSIFMFKSFLGKELNETSFIQFNCRTLVCYNGPPKKFNAKVSPN